MTTMTPNELLTAPAPLGVSDPIRPLRFSTIAAVEARKMIDTRGTRALIGVIAALAAAVLAYQVGQDELPNDFGDFVGTASWVVVFLAPIIGLLAMTTEWTQRTALTTFTLAPRRGSVLAAKTLAATGWSLAVFAVIVAMSGAAAAIDGATFSGAASDVAGYGAIVVLQTLMGVGLGALAGMTAPALVMFLAAPTSVAFVAGQGSGETSRWFDVFAAYDQIQSDQPTEHLAQSLVAITLWVAVPIVAGLLRSLRREAK